MSPRSVHRAITAVLLLTPLACAQHEPAGPGPGDYSPPKIIAAAAWDATHLILAFDEPVTRATAENPDNYEIRGRSGPKVTTAAFSSNTVHAVALHDDNRIATLTTFTMSDESYVITAKGIADVRGNEIVTMVELPFEGTNIADTTPPEIVHRVPQTDATGISTRVFITVGFSEQVDPYSFARGFKVAGDGARLMSVAFDDSIRYTCRVDSLRANETYTVSVKGAKDLAGNVMPDRSWTFNTQATYDTAPPTVVSWQPANFSVNVDLDASLVLTFSEPMDPFSIILRPSVQPLRENWSNGNRRVTYEVPWLPARQYTVQIRPGEMSDQAGNRSTQLYTLTFSAGPEIQRGSIAGRISGDPQSAWPIDPTGGLALASRASPQDLYTSVASVINADDSYKITHLPGGTYYSFCVIDTDGDGVYQPGHGDAVGVYGVSDWFTDTPKTLNFSNVQLIDIDYGLYDPTAVYGLLIYEGPYVGLVHVGLFDANGFDPLTSVPVVSIEAVRDGTWDYVINTLDTGTIPEASYYVSAYLDRNRNGLFDPAIDPVGVHAGAITLTHGKDFPAVNITLIDPGTAVTASAVHWPDSPRSALLERIETMLEAREAP